MMPNYNRCFLAVTLQVFLLVKFLKGDLTTTSKCQDQYLNLNCGPSAILLFSSATYGRTDKNTCGEKGISGCYKDVELLVKRLCSGRQECHMAVNDETISNPCHGGEKSELTLVYKCVAEHSVVDQCVKDPVQLKEGIGYIVSPHYPFPYQDNIRCKWKLFLGEGQHVNLTLFDFELDGRRNTRCYDYLAILDITKSLDAYQDHSQRTLFMDCGIINRGQVQSTPGATELEIHFVSFEKTRSRGFIIEYEVYGGIPEVVEPVYNIPVNDPKETNSSLLPSPSIVTADPKDDIGPADVDIASTTTFLPIKPDGQELEELNAPSFGIGIIVGVVASLALLLVIAVVALVLYRRYRNRINKPSTPYYVNERANHEMLIASNPTPPPIPTSVPTPPPPEVDKGRTIVMEIQGDRITKLYPGTGRNTNTLKDPPDKTFRVLTLKGQGDSVIYAKPEIGSQRKSLPAGMYDDGYIPDAFSLARRSSLQKREFTHEYATIDDARPYAVSDIANFQTIPRDYPCNPPPLGPNRQSQKYYDYDNAFSTLGRSNYCDSPVVDDYYSPVESTPNHHSNDTNFSTFLQKRRQSNPENADIFETGHKPLKQCNV